MPFFLRDRSNIFSCNNLIINKPTKINILNYIPSPNKYISRGIYDLSHPGKVHTIIFNSTLSLDLNNLTSINFTPTTQNDVPYLFMFFEPRLFCCLIVGECFQNSF